MERRLRLSRGAGASLPLRKNSFSVRMRKEEKKQTGPKQKEPSRLSRAGETGGQLVKREKGIQNQERKLDNLMATGQRIEIVSAK